MRIYLVSSPISRVSSTEEKERWVKAADFTEEFLPALESCIAPLLTTLRNMIDLKIWLTIRGYFARAILIQLQSPERSKTGKVTIMFIHRFIYFFECIETPKLKTVAKFILIGNIYYIKWCKKRLNGVDGALRSQWVECMLRTKNSIDLLIVKSRPSKESRSLCVL